MIDAWVCVACWWMSMEYVSLIDGWVFDGIWVVVDVWCLAVYDGMGDGWLMIRDECGMMVDWLRSSELWLVMDEWWLMFGYWWLCSDEWVLVVGDLWLMRCEWILTNAGCWLVNDAVVVVIDGMAGMWWSMNYYWWVMSDGWSWMVDGWWLISVELVLLTADMWLSVDEVFVITENWTLDVD